MSGISTSSRECENGTERLIGDVVAAQVYLVPDYGPRDVSLEVFDIKGLASLYGLAGVV